MKMLKVILIICAFLTACSVTKTPVEPFNKDSLIKDIDEIPEVAQLYKASYGNIWEAMLATVQEMGNPLQTVNEKDGVLVTNWAPFYDGLFVVRRDCFIIHVTKQAGGRVEVRIKRAVQAVKKKSRYALCTDGEIETWMLHRIEQKLK